MTHILGHDKIDMVLCKILHFDWTDLVNNANLCSGEGREVCIYVLGKGWLLAFRMNATHKGTNRVMTCGCKVQESESGSCRTAELVLLPRDPSLIYESRISSISTALLAVLLGAAFSHREGSFTNSKSGMVTLMVSTARSTSVRSRSDDPSGNLHGSVYQLL